jgi:hypothetical protein
MNRCISPISDPSKAEYGDIYVEPQLPYVSPMISNEYEAPECGNPNQICAGAFVRVNFNDSDSSILMTSALRPAPSPE